VFRSTYQVQPWGLTRDEFGRALYEAVFTIGGILGIEQQRAAAIHHGHGYKLQRLMARRAVLQQDLAQRLPMLNESEMARVLAIYPWVVHA
jgi:hypothetical protein